MRARRSSRAPGTPRCAAAHCALTAAALVAEGERSAYALCRPPGHHAGRSVYGGYCFLNNAALAAQHLRDAGFARVAMLDVDYHHGNGTQDIFCARDDVLFVSIHGDAGHRVPVLPRLRRRARRRRGRGLHPQLPAAARHRLGGVPATRWTARWTASPVRAEALVVSLGVDTFEGDPISAFRLAAGDFPRMGATLAALGLPTVFVQEGGYAVEEIGDNVVGVLAGFAGA